MDKSVVKFDGYVNAVRRDMYKDYEFILYNENGEEILEKGGAFILDNGYLQIPCIMEASKTSTSQPEIKWSEMNESLRKDIECTNGEIKQEVWSKIW